MLTHKVMYIRMNADPNPRPPPHTLNTHTLTHTYADPDPPTPPPIVTYTNACTQMHTQQQLMTPPLPYTHTHMQQTHAHMHTQHQLITWATIQSMLPLSTSRARSSLSRRMPLPVLCSSSRARPPSVTPHASWSLTCGHSTVHD